MFRISSLVRELIEPTPLGPQRRPAGPVVIWNLIRRCNLTCRHCYSISADTAFAGELSTAEAMGVLDQLKAARVPALILSGGEPLSRFDFFEIAERARARNFKHLSLSTNGTRIAENIGRIADLEVDVAAHRATRAGKPLDLTPHEFKLLERLARNAGHAVTRTMLLESLWGFHFDPRANLIDAHISRLRAKVDRGFDQELIHTIRGVGYVLKAPD